MPHPPANSPEPFGRESAPRLADLTADLLWPRLFQTVSLSLKPERIGLAFFGLVVAMAIGSLAEFFNISGSNATLPNSTSFVLDSLATAFAGIASGVFGLSATDIVAGIGGILSLPIRVWSTYGWVSLLHLPAALSLAVAGGAISRMAACDFSQGVVLSWTDGLKFSVRKAGALITAFIAPLILVAVIAAGLAVGGILLGWPGVNILGAILYGLFLIAAALAVFLLACWTLGLPLLIPAIACEGTDGLDAIQRAYAYVLGRPLRLLAYAAIALVLGWAATLIASLFAGATTTFAQWAATGFSGSAGDAIINGGPSPDGAPLAGVDSFASHITQFWIHIPGTLVWSLALTLFFCGSTVVYLLIRQVCDGQDWGELWMPGMIEGTMAQAMQARANAGGFPADTEAPTRIGVLDDSGKRERIAADDDDDDA